MYVCLAGRGELKAAQVDPKFGSHKPKEVRTLDFLATSLVIHLANTLFRNMGYP